MKRILIAGIGNIFLGDDAFGVEVVRELSHRVMPPEVSVIDFGIRGYDLAYALADGFDAVIMVDASPQGQAPGTIYLIEPDLRRLGELESGGVDAHSLNPVHVLQMAATLGPPPEKLFLVGCEPAELESTDGAFGLSDAVSAAVPKAAELVESVVSDLLNWETKKAAAYSAV